MGIKMKNKVLKTVVLAVMATLAFAGCAGKPSAATPSADNSGDTKQEAGAGANDTASSSAAESAAGTSSPKETGGDTQQRKVTLTIDGEEYTFPMSFEDFAARGWEYYDPADTEALNREVQANLYDWRYFSNGDIKTIIVYATNHTDSNLAFKDCEITGMEVDYSMQIEMRDAREFVSVPTGSIKINGLGIGEAKQSDFAREFGEATFSNSNGGSYSNGDEMYSPEEDSVLMIDYDENAVMERFQYRLL